MTHAHDDGGAVPAMFLEILRDRLGLGDTDASALAAAICSEQDAIEAAHQHWVTDPMADHHLHSTARMLAAYRVLLRTHPAERILPVLRAAFIEPSLPAGRARNRKGLDEAADGLTLLAAVSRNKEEHAYGPTFTFKRARDDTDAYHLNIRRCFFHSFFVANGVPELTPIYCDWDTIWSGAIDPARHGVRFERPTTLGYGGDMCRFYFDRVPRADEHTPVRPGTADLGAEARLRDPEVGGGA